MTKLILLLSLILFSGCIEIDEEKIMNYVYEREIPTEEFNELTVAGYFDIFYTQGYDISVVLKAKDITHLETVKYYYENQVLTIYNEGENEVVRNRNRNVNVNKTFIFNGQTSNVSIKTSNRLLLYITAPSIENIETAGAASINFEPDIYLPSLSFDIAGSSNIILPNINTQKLSFNLAGSSKITMSGTTDLLTIDSAGAGNVNAKDLISIKVIIEAAGAFSGNIYALAEFDVELAGAGKIDYWGNPVVRKEVSGLGRIQHRGN